VVGRLAKNPRYWQGENKMGLILERVRAVLRGQKFNLVIGDSIVRGLNLGPQTVVVSKGGAQLLATLVFVRDFCGPMWDKVVIHAGICSLSNRKRLPNGSFVYNLNNKQKANFKREFSVLLGQIAIRFPQTTFFYSSVLPRHDALANSFFTVLRVHNNYAIAEVHKRDLPNLFVVSNMNFGKNNSSLMGGDRVHLSATGKIRLQSNLSAALRATTDQMSQWPSHTLRCV